MKITERNNFAKKGMQHFTPLEELFLNLSEFRQWTNENKLYEIINMRREKKCQ